MKNKNIRILWICNHKTLMNAECNLLMKLGFEIFVPKLLGNERSSAINFEWDKTLSIPHEDLLKLNSFDFYNSEYTLEIKEILNKYFSIALCVNVYPALYNLVTNFSGKIILRAFGYENDINYEKTTTCTPRIKGLKHLFRPKEITYDNIMMRNLCKIKDRFYLGVGYKSIIQNETSFFAKRSVFLPLGVPDFIWKKKNTNNGRLKKLMFVCPSIENPYYGNIYNEFKLNFGDIPHLIFGKQNREYPEDKTIMGYLKSDDFDTYLRSCKVMFYHSSEKRHLHYHPIEAIIYGMPLIFMKGGLLEYFGGSNQPGMACSVEEAKEKIRRILNEDRDFINEVKENQVKILTEFKDEFIYETWKENFLPLTKGE